MAGRGADRLAPYRAKRDFHRTPEPQGGEGGGPVRRYAMQKHAARRLHYDLRLEHDGALLSWAVTRGPHLSPKTRRLAVRTEDHPLDYADFEGVIPAGYGAGTVMLWDEGAWEPLEDPDVGLEKGRLRLRLDGRRLKGEWTLARTGREGARENWLFIKRSDEAAEDADPTERFTTSVRTGRDLDQIAGASPPPKRTPPRFVPPMLATPADRPPSGPEWLHEIKHDGYRMIAVIVGGRARLHTRSGLDWTERFGELGAAFERLGLDEAVIDGEVVAPGEAGRADFSALQKALSDGGALSCYVFDLLNVEGEDLRGAPLAERRRRLRGIVGAARGPIRFSDDVAGDGPGVLDAACRLGAEGVISKRAESRYRSERSRLWLKIKCVKREEFVVGGFRTSDRPGRPFASLLIGAIEDGRLIYRGGVGTGFDGHDFAALEASLNPLVRDGCPFASVPTDARRRAVWVEPRVRVEVRYAETTSDGMVRHGAFIGLRDDVAAPRPGRAGGGRSPKLTNADKVLYPESGRTKGDVAAYLEAVSARMLPTLAGRPLTFLRCPDGRESCFFQKHHGRGTPDVVRRFSRAGDREPFMHVGDAAGLAACAQLGVLELHIGGARVDDLDRPERLVFDLDPDEGMAFAAVKEAARDMRDVLQAAGLPSFPLLTGGKGVHVVTPLTPHADWTAVKAFARAIAYALTRARPDRYLAKASKARRKGLIFIDWLRNADGASAVAPYSPRARPGAPVAAPVDWATLAKAERADAYDLTKMRARLSRLRREPWEGYEAARRPLTPDLAEALRKLA